MSTRCQLGFYDTVTTPMDKPCALIYRHSDGYPDGVLPLLVPWAIEFNANRGLGDAHYAAARCLASMIAEHDQDLAEYGKQYTGFEICGDHGLHGDIEYFYRVDPSGIKVYAVDFDAEFSSVKKPIKNIPITRQKP